MAHDVLSALKAAVEGWVLQKDPSSPPAPLTYSDIHALARAGKAAVSVRGLSAGQDEWGNLKELTKDWIVQKGPDAKPGPLSPGDFEHIATVTLTTPRRPASPVAVMQGVMPSPQPVSPQPPVFEPLAAIWDREAPALVFARDHLEHCL